jgi:NADH:ubiquinone oxidoreductase subunit 2 (subunit N)
VVWIVFPGVVAAALYLLRKWTRLVKAVGIMVALILALLAWQVPIGKSIPLGAIPFLPSLTLAESLTIFGRSFILNDASRSALIIIYLGTAVWFIGASTIPVSRLFIPLGLAIAALLTAAISVEPFLYAALFIQMAVLLSVPILSPPGQTVSRGALRFLIFQTLGMILLVFSGWMVNNIELYPNDTLMILRTSVFIGLGFAMAMSVFPFNTWIPMVAAETPPFSTAYVFFTLPEVISLFAFNIFGQFSWLPFAPSVYLSFTIVGLIMIIGAGFWSIFQNNLGRIFGYAVITEIGLILITIGQILIAVQLSPVSNTNLITRLPFAEFFFALLLPRGLTLAIWALSLAIIKTKCKDLNLPSVRGIAYQLPVASIGLALASFSLAGFPLLAGFPVRAVLGIGIAQQTPWLAELTLIGYFGLIIAALRSISVLVSQPGERFWQLKETRLQFLLLLLGCLFLIIVGIFPRFFLNGLARLLP